MSSCAAYFEKNLRVNLLLVNVTLEEIAAIKQYLAFYRKHSKNLIGPRKRWLWRKEK